MNGLGWWWQPHQLLRSAWRGFDALRLLGSRPRTVMTGLYNNTLREPAPSDVLRAADATDAELVVSVSTDIDMAGQYRTQWLLASPQRLWVVDAQPPRVHLSIALADTSDVRVLAVVGSGIVQARVEGAWLDLVRFSNRLKYTFARATRVLEALRKAEPIEQHLGREPEAHRCPNCHLPLESPGEPCPRCVSQRTAFRRMLLLMRPHYKAGYWMLGLLFAGVILDMITPLLTGLLVDDVLIVQPGVVPAIDPKWALTLIVLAFALLQISRNVLNSFNSRLAARVGSSIAHDIRTRLVDHLSKLGLSYFDRQQAGALVGRVNYDTEAVQGFMHQLTSGFIVQLLMVVFSLLFMFSLNPALAIWTLVPAPLVVLGSLNYWRYVSPQYNRVYDRAGKQSAQLNSLISGIRVVKAFGQETYERGRFDNASDSVRQARMAADYTSAWFFPVTSIFFQVGGWLVWYFGGLKVLESAGLADPHMTVGELIAFFGYLGLFYGPLGALTNLTSWLVGFSTQMHRIFEVLDTPISVPESNQPVDLPQLQGHIQFENVTFGYRPDSPVLRDVNFEVLPGQTVGIVGRSGSGKTTIINLVSRFYDVNEGRILIDGHDIRSVKVQDLRQQIGIVLQEPFLFRGTIRENLVYGKHNASMEATIASAKAANAHDFILKQMHGYDTWVGERGAGLSGGERQRLSIARALLCDPRVLILDEATSSVDSESELQIQQALAELVKGRTSIIIAHRLSTLRNCDQIFAVDNGHVVERGTHADLMSLDGHYARLVKIQTGQHVEANASTDELVEAEQRSRSMETVMPEKSVALQRDADTGLAPIGSYAPRWLTPEIARIHLGNYGALHVTVRNERIYHGAFALRCMPVQHPLEYISLRYIDIENREQEIGLLRRLDDWPAESQRLVREALLRRYFVHTITGVESIKSFAQFLAFTVRTERGLLEFVARNAQDVVQDYGQRGKIIIDVEDNRYLIPDVSALPTPDRRLFERYVYW